MMSFTLITCFCIFHHAIGFLVSLEPTFADGDDVATLVSTINEASGLAASRVHPGVLYTHMDEVGDSEIFAISANDGTLLATLNITNAVNHDWEDIAVGVCPRNHSESCIYIGDIGDHSGSGSHKNIYIVPEPAVIQDEHLASIEDLHFDWNVTDTETLMVDPDGDVILISRVHGGQAAIGRIPAADIFTDTTYTIVHTSTLKIPPSQHEDPVGGDISVSGKEVIIRTFKNIYHWTVSNEDYLTALSTETPTEIPEIDETKPGGIAWDRHGVNFYTVGELTNAPIHHYRRF